MALLNFVWLTLTAISLALAAPRPYIGAPPPGQPPQYFLRCHAPEQPWHKRHLVLLPTSRLLGLENFTVHPATPPLTFSPVQIPSTSSYALRLPYGGDDLTRTPYLSAVFANSTRSSNFGAHFGSDPNHIANCPKEKQCSANAWSIYEGDSGAKRLSLEIFPGAFEAVKDAPNDEGWHLYWRGSGSPAAWATKIEFEIVPIEHLGSD